MKLPDTLLHTLALSASSLLLRGVPVDAALALLLSSESGHLAVVTNIQTASDATPTPPEPLDMCTACGRG